MTVIGPRQPGESRQEYIDRVVLSAGLPSPEQHAQLAALLGPLGGRRQGEGNAAARQAAEAAEAQQAKAGDPDAA